jgi:hypothetical protein
MSDTNRSSRRDLFRLTAGALGGAVAATSLAATAAQADESGTDGLSPGDDYALARITAVTGRKVHVQVVSARSTTRTQRDQEFWAAYDAAIPAISGTMTLIRWLDDGTARAEPLFWSVEGRVERASKRQLRLSTGHSLRIRSFSTFRPSTNMDMRELQAMDPAGLLGANVRVAYLRGTGGVSDIVAGVSPL